jgi:hypothetical protein
MALPQLPQRRATERSRIPAVEGLLNRLRDPGPELTPEERVRRAAVGVALRGLSEAEREHASRVRTARQTLRRTERAHRAAVEAAGKKLRKAERTAASAIADVEHKRVAATSPRELGRYGSLRVFEDHIDTGTGTVPLAPESRAVIGPVSVLARTLPESGVPDRVIDVKGRYRSRSWIRSDRIYLALECPRTRLLVEVRDESEAREFAALVNVAVLNVDRLIRARHEAQMDLDRQVGEVREEQRAAVEEARSQLEAVEAGRDPVEAAADALAAAEADTGEIVRRREQLAAIERAESRSTGS